MNEKNPFVFVVDDDASMRDSLKNLIGSAGLAVQTFASAQEFLTSQRPDGAACLVLDVQLPGLSGLDLQQDLAKVDVQIPIIFITGHGDIPTTFKAMKAGAIEFLTKPFRGEDLLNAVEQAIKRSREIEQLGNHPAEAKPYFEDDLRSQVRFSGFVGQSAALRRAPKDVETVARTDSTVLIHGETGTGKELIASAKAKSDVPLEDSILDDAVPLESILRTEELYRRPSRSPDYGKENGALAALVSALADSPHTILQTLAEKVLDVLQADSAGLSLLTKDEKRFYWPAIAGAWQPHIGGGTPRNSGPCGDVLDRNGPMLFTHWEWRYPYLRRAAPLAQEGLLVPFYVNGKAVGTIWAIAHTNHRKFDAEDLRLLESLGRFASSAYQALASIDDLKFQIAAREKAETAVLKLATGLEAKVRRLVDANIIGIVIWNVDGRILEANHAFLRMVGYGREDLESGRVSWRGVTPDKWRAADERALAEVTATGVCEPFEKEYFRKDGSRVPVLVGAALLEGSGEEGVAFVLDLTERKRAEGERLKLEERLRRAEKMEAIGRLAGGIAHDFNNVLGGICAFGEMLYEEAPESSSRKRHARNLLTAAARGRALVEQILAYSHSQGGKREPTDIGRMVVETLELVRGSLPPNVTVESRAAGLSLVVMSNATQLHQLIMNLCSNAIHALGKGGALRVALAASDVSAERALSHGRLTRGRYACLAVEDSGCGMEAATLARIFEPFFTTREVGRGTGLGLSIVYAIVIDLGGAIDVKSAPAQGSTFAVYLPLAGIPVAAA